MWLKRLNAPKIWLQPPKKYKYSVNPSPGPHPKNFCIPLAVIIRDVLHYAENLKEAKTIIKQRKVLVDGRVVTNYKYPCGLFDVISFPEINEHYRITVNKKGLTLIKIDEKEADMKIVKVKNKTKISPDTYQITFHDGKNILTKDNSIKTHDSLLIELPNLKPLKHIKFEVGKIALIFDGENRGSIGEIEEITPSGFNKKSLVRIKKENEKITTIRDYVIVVGEEKPLITL
ncbi:MAG: 30S ribosomal protein S4e [Candidatus Aenigmatarchaeota archaeon]